MSRSSTSRRLGETLERALVEAGAPHVLTQRPAGVIALVQCGDAELRTMLAPLVEDERSVLVGVGRPVEHFAEVPDSLRDAEIAVERLGYETGRRLLAFEDFDLGALLISEAPTERIGPKVESMLAPLREHPLLHDAIVAYFEHDMDVGRTAKALCLHPNTLALPARAAGGAARPVAQAAGGDRRAVHRAGRGRAVTRLTPRRTRRTSRR